MVRPAYDYSQLNLLFQFRKIRELNPKTQIILFGYEKPRLNGAF